MAFQLWAKRLNTRRLESHPVCRQTIRRRILSSRWSTSTARRKLRSGQSLQWWRQISAYVNAPTRYVITPFFCNKWTQYLKCLDIIDDARDSNEDDVERENFTAILDEINRRKVSTVDTSRLSIHCRRLKDGFQVFRNLSTFLHWIILSTVLRSRLFKITFYKLSITFVTLKLNF